MGKRKRSLQRQARTGLQKTEIYLSKELRLRLRRKADAMSISFSRYCAMTLAEAVGLALQ